MVQPKVTPLDPETVSTAWLSSLGHVLLDHLMEEILPSIPNLTAAGAAQLSSDLDYLSNISSAINVHSGTLDQWKLLVSLEDDEEMWELDEVAVPTDSKGLPSYVWRDLTRDT